MVKRAQALVEFAIIAPIMLLIVFGAVVLGVGYDQKIQMIVAGRFGAEYGAVHSSGSASSQTKTLFGTSVASYDEVQNVMGWDADGLSGAILGIIQALSGKDAKMTVNVKSRFSPDYNYNYQNTQRYQAGWSSNDRRHSESIQISNNLYKNLGDVADALIEGIKDSFDNMKNIFDSIDIADLLSPF